MTSSLVGSEMCIRDRHDCVAWAVQAVLASCQPTSVEMIAGSPAEADPVSYTHLTLPTICSV
eukprot:4017320-Prorocentrum_lima.AAC.1